jgi:hypothetical protein
MFYEIGFKTPTKTIGNHMYLSLGKAAKEAGVAKSTISKALSSGKLSYREKNSDGYQIDPAELFRVYPKTAKTDADEPSSNDWQPLVPKARTVLPPRVMAIPDGFFCTDSRRRSVTQPEMRKVGPRTAVI